MKAMLTNTTSVPRTTRGRLAAAAIGAIASGALLLGIAAPASAGEVIATEIVASDTPTSTVAASVPTAMASKPRAITVSNQRGKSVVLFAKGEQIRRNLAPGKAPVTFTGLTAGRVYTVAVGGAPIGTVVALDAPASASGLSVSTTDRPGTVALQWSHRATRATGGADTQYVVAATSPTAKTVTATVTGARTAELSGLDPQALYSFSVTPRNSAGSGKATKASMTRTLAQLTGTPSKSADTPVPSQPKPTESTPTPAPAPAPAPAPGPSTRTIWVCPDGYREIAGQCQTTQAYTFHSETQTQAYTYTWTQTGTRRNTDNQTCGYLPDAQGNPVVECWGGYDEPVYSNVKDATPAGYTDNGSAWVRTIQVKDTAPTGYADDGTQWVKTAAKVERTIPA
jgi:hypothetical protein